MRVITIGRSTENNDIVVNDEKVSRNHLQMVMDDNGNYSVVDLGSTNGTYVNGQRISGEVRLQPSDEVRIGQTVLPWRNYFPASPQPPTKELSMSPQPPKPVPNHTWLYVIIGAALLLLIGGGVTWMVSNKHPKDIVQPEPSGKDEAKQLEDEANAALLEAARLSEEYEKALRKAAESQSDDDRKYAQQMREKKEEAERLAQQKETEWNKMKAALNEANQARKAAQQKSEMDSIAKVNAEQEVKVAKDKATEAKEAEEYAEKKAKLTTEFYRLVFNVNKEKVFENVCNEMNWKPGKKADKRVFVEDKFDKADNDEKQLIINVIKRVSGQQTNVEKMEEAKIDAPIEGNASEQSAPTTNDTIKQ